MPNLYQLEQQQEASLAPLLRAHPSSTGRHAAYHQGSCRTHIFVFTHFNHEETPAAVTGIKGKVTDLMLPCVGDKVQHRDVSGAPLNGKVTDLIFRPENCSDNCASRLNHSLNHRLTMISSQVENGPLSGECNLLFFLLLCCLAVVCSPLLIERLRSLERRASSQPEDRSVRLNGVNAIIRSPDVVDHYSSTTLSINHAPALDQA